MTSGVLGKVEGRRMRNLMAAQWQLPWNQVLSVGGVAEVLSDMVGWISH